MKFFLFIKKVLSGLVKDRCFNNAASIAYFSVLSALPIVFFITSAVGFFIGSNLVVSKKIFELISPYLPNFTPQMWQKLTSWFTRSSLGLNVLNIVVLMLSSTLIFSSVDNALQDIFKERIRKNRGSLESLLLYFFLIILLAAAIFVYLNFDLLISFLKKLSRRQEFYFLAPVLRKADLTVPVFTLIIQIFSIFMVFRVFIGRIFNIKHVIYVSAFIVVMWTIAIKIFTWYVTFITNYNVIYGSMSIFIILISWCFYAALIFLLGAEILKVLTEK